MTHSPEHICSQGGKEYLMRAHFGLPSVISEETEGKPPIQVKFEIPYFTTSGIQVLFTTAIQTPSIRTRYLFLRSSCPTRETIKMNLLCLLFIHHSGSLFEDYWEEWLPSLALGSLHHPERWLPVEDQLILFRPENVQQIRRPTVVPAYLHQLLLKITKKKILLFSRHPPKPSNCCRCSSVSEICAVFPAWFVECFAFL